LLALLAFTAAGAAHAAPGDLACNQEPGGRFYWLERAFCDLEVLGPDRAQGLIIWNHGIQGTTESWKAPAPPVLRLVQARGWDVILLKRHLAFAPGIRPSGGGGALDPTIVERILERARVGRLAVVFPNGDARFGNIARGERARPILAKRDLPWMMVDESAGEITGHGGAVTGRFALRYGRCLSDFLSAVALPAGRVECQPAGDDWRIARELLLPPGGRPPDAAVNPIDLRWRKRGRPAPGK
jgi:hypothetical protein